MALLAGSPAIDAGSNALAVGPDGKPLLTDQRGYYRIFNGTVDIGAYEFGSSPLLPGDADADGKVDFTDLVLVARNYGKTNTTWSDGDFNNDGSVGFDDLLIVAQLRQVALAHDRCRGDVLGVCCRWGVVSIGARQGVRRCGIASSSAPAVDGPTPLSVSTTIVRFALQSRLDSVSLSALLGIALDKKRFRGRVGNTSRENIRLGVGRNHEAVFGDRVIRNQKKTPPVTVGVFRRGENAQITLTWSLNLFTLKGVLRQLQAPSGLILGSGRRGEGNFAAAFLDSGQGLRSLRLGSNFRIMLQNRLDSVKVFALWGTVFDGDGSGAAVGNTSPADAQVFEKGDDHEGENTSRPIDRVWIGESGGGIDNRLPVRDHRYAQPH